jgi:outer membrane protein
MERSLLVALGLTLLVSSPLQASEVVDSTVGRMENYLGKFIMDSAHKDKGAKPLKEGDATITLTQSLTIALEENLDLASKEVALKGKKASETATFRKMLPTLSLSSSRSDIIDNTALSGSEAESYSTTFTLAQPLYQGRSLWGGWKKAELATRQAQLDLVRQGQQLVSDVKTAWYSVLEKDRLLSASIEAFERLRIHEENAKAYFKVGRYWQNEVLQAQVEVAKGEQAVIEAENDLLIAKSTLNRLMRRPLEHPVKAQGDLAWISMEGWSLKEAYDKAKTTRSDLEKSYLDLKTNQWSEITSSSDLLPQVDFTATQNWTAERVKYHENDSKTTATISLTWTAWNWGQTAKEVVAAKATTRQSQLTYEDKIQAVLLEVRTAFLNAQEASKKVKVLEKALAQAEENLKVNEIRYQQQLGSATDVLDAMDLRTTTRNSHISSLSSYLTALATLDLAVGKDVDLLIESR